MLPAAVAAPYEALLADRHSRRAILLAGALSRGVLMAAIAAAASAGAPVAAVLVLAAAFTIAGVAHKPAQAALLPQLARTPAELAAANVCWSAIDNAAFLGGSLAAGVVAAAAGLDVAFAACAVPFFVAAVLVARMRADARPAPSGGEAVSAVGEVLEGARTIGRHPEMRLLVGMFAADMLVQAVMDVLLVVAAFQVLAMGQSGVGWLNAAWGLGGVVGAGAAAALLGRGRLASGLALGCVLSGLPLALIAGIPVPPIAAVLLVVLGLGYGLVESSLLTLTQRLASDDVLARVFGVQETLEVVATGVGSIAAAGLVAVLGAKGALVAAGLVLPLVAVVLHARLLALEAGAPVPERAFVLLRGLPIFAPLPLATVENLAVRATSERFEPGAAVVTQGDEGHSFYVISEGSVAVHEDGVLRRHMGPGEFFGGIALLRDVRRTATVRAATATTALAIERDDFLGGVSSHARSAHEAEGVVARHLRASATAPAS